MNVRQNRAKAQTKPTKTPPTLPRIEDITPSGEAQAIVDRLQYAVEGYFRWAKYSGRGYSEETEKAFTAWLWDNQRGLARAVEAVYLSMQSSPVDLPSPDTALNRLRLVLDTLGKEAKAFNEWNKAHAARTKALGAWDEDYGAAYAKAEARVMRASQQWADTRKAVAGALRLTRNLPGAFIKTYSFIDARGARGVFAANLYQRMDGVLRGAWDSIEAWENMNEHDFSPSGPNSDYRAFLRDKTGEPIQRLLKDEEARQMLERMPSRGFVPPKDERTTIEGFRVILRDYEPENETHVNNLRAMREGLRVFRKQAERYFPEMLHPPYTRHPITLDMAKRSEGYGGFNRDGAVLMNGEVSWSPEGFAEVLAHEMGHTAYKVLSPAAREAWDALVSEDGTFHVSELLPLALHLNLDPNRHPLTTLANTLLWHSENNGNVEYEWLYHQIITALSEYASGRHKTGSADTLAYKYGGSVDSPLRTLPMAQLSEVSFPLNPTTAYGGNNPDEALAETFKHYVVEGPRAVNPRVRALFQQIFKGLRRNPDDENDETPPEGRG